MNYRRFTQKRQGNLLKLIMRPMGVGQEVAATTVSLESVIDCPPH